MRMRASFLPAIIATLVCAWLAQAQETTPDAQVKPASGEEKTTGSTAPGALPEGGAEPLKNEESAEDGKYLLRYKVKAGEVMRWEIVHQFQFDTTVNGTTQQARTYSKSVKAWRVEDVDDEGNFTFNHIVESTMMWQELTGRARVTWDSTKAEAVPAGFEDVAKSLKRVLYVVKMDRHGEILKRLVKYQSPGFDDGAAERQMTVPLPKEPVAIGHSWFLNYPIRLQLENGSYKSFDARDRFSLVGVKDGVATISNETQILTPVRDPSLEAQLVQRGGKGEIDFDLATGRVIRQRTDVDKNAVGFRGQASSIHYVSRFTERYLNDSVDTAQKRHTTTETK